jgi:non-heme chloroperoxidase
MRSFLQVCASKPHPPEDFETALCWNIVVPARVRANLGARELDCDDVLRALAVPLLVTQGRADTVVLPAMAEHILATCPTADRPGTTALHTCRTWRSPSASTTSWPS